MHFDDLTGRLVGARWKQASKLQPSSLHSGVPVSARAAQGPRKGQSEHSLGTEAGPFLADPLVPRCWLCRWDKARGYCGKAAKPVLSVSTCQL